MIRKLICWLYNEVVLKRPKKVVDKVYYKHGVYGVFNLVVLPDGTKGVWLWRGRFEVIDKPSDVVWLTCLPSKYFKD